MLSNGSSQTYNPDRTGPAADNRWQIIITDGSRAMEVKAHQKVVLIPNKKQSATRLFSVTPAHEIEGHVLQNENKVLLPLKIFERVGTGDTTIFAEGGAKWHEDYVSTEAFGFGSPAKPHYIRAMATKLSGGSFAECVATYYRSMNEPLTQRRNSEEITQEAFMSQTRKDLKTAYTSTLRLFKFSQELTSTAATLTNSKDTVYVEQTLLAEALHDANLEQYLMVNGASTDALILLKKAGLINDSSIRQPDHYALKIWEREKSKFTHK